MPFLNSTRTTIRLHTPVSLSKQRERSSRSDSDRLFDEVVNISPIQIGHKSQRPDEEHGVDQADIQATVSVVVVESLSQVKRLLFTLAAEDGVGSIAVKVYDVPVELFCSVSLGEKGYVGQVISILPQRAEVGRG